MLFRKLVKLLRLLILLKLFNLAKNKNYNVLFLESVYVQVTIQITLYISNCYI